jgi:hypothetical protein
MSRTPAVRTPAVRTPAVRTPQPPLHLPVQLKLAAAWASFMFLYIYVDYLALYKPGIVDDILAGVVLRVRHQPNLRRHCAHAPWPSRAS